MSSTQSRTLSPFRIQKALRGLRYPAAKEDVVQRARMSGVEQELLAALLDLPDEEYASPISLARRIAYIRA